ncbi:helix-turn-helix transcriptional regulator [Saccharopolyspora elongata]|uniref:Helix-turn-helix transcriptional regulator n=1 Tax=Saccharopolyspora elongata TaxID=2530387 RepID=A0A4R4Z9Z2_9PSEU|nr:LuxR family transcriptional regulator [Saccharopolyspora elongata]TDD53959.1 helix-turn-helix transcriptional regulator [Saccharopolyspora elongata]
MIVGRADELARIDELLVAARAGRGGALVIRGEAGIGKTALLTHADTGGMQVLRIACVDGEAELPHAGLHLLLRGQRTDELPAEQAGALRSAFGLEPARDPDRFLVGMAVLTLLGRLAAHRPLLCVIDDAHWLDGASAEALLFAARRLDGERVAVLFAARDSFAPDFPAPGVPELRLGGLDEAAAADLLAADLPGLARAAILREARGNPLALLEIRRTGLGYDPGAPPLRHPVQRGFAARLAELPPRTRTLLLIAAAADAGEAEAVLDAASRLDSSIVDLASAENAGLIRLSGGVFVFGHPLLQATAYQSAELVQRLAAHRALAAAFADRADPGRRAWHLAAATLEPDEDIAAELQRIAADVRGCGGYAVAAELHRRSAALTPDPRRRGRRLLAAARAAANAGRLQLASGLVEETGRFLTDPVDLAEAVDVAAVLAHEQGRRPYRELVDAAADIAARAPELAGRLLFRAAKNAWESGDLAAVVDAAGSADALGRSNSALVGALARTATGFGRLTTGGAVDGMAALREMRTELGVMSGSLRKRAVIVWSHVLLGDFRTARELATALETGCRTDGAIGLLPNVLALSAMANLQLGDLQEVRNSSGEGLRLAEEMGQTEVASTLAVVLAHLAALEGDDVRCRELLDVALRDGAPAAAIRATRALALADLAAGRPESVLDRADDIAAGLTRMDARNGLPELIEAAARVGQPERAQGPCDWYSDWAANLGRPWAEAVALRCRALLSEGDVAERQYAAAVHLHREGDELPFERARTELLYGEWLRRRHRRTDSRPHLRSALDTFDRLGTRPWAERARDELRASGESRGASADPAARLTPQERQVARLAATGLTNRDIAARLFLSPRTVGYHLSNAYPKLGVASRLELARLPGLPE